jgi:hypothetical protein
MWQISGKDEDKGKGKFYPGTGHEGAEGEYSLLFN